MEFTARIPETPLLVRHTAAVSAGEGFSMGHDGAWSRTVGLRNRSSLVLGATGEKRRSRRRSRRKWASTKP